MHHIKEDYRDNYFNKSPIFIRVLDETINQYALSLFKCVKYMTSKIKHGEKELQLWQLTSMLNCIVPFLVTEFGPMFVTNNNLTCCTALPGMLAFFPCLAPRLIRGFSLNMKMAHMTFLWLLPDVFSFTLTYLLLLFVLFLMFWNVSVFYAIFAKKHTLQSQERLYSCLIHSGMLWSSTGSGQSCLMPKSIDWTARSICKFFWPPFLEQYFPHPKSLWPLSA